MSWSSKSCGCFQSSKRSVAEVRVVAASNHQRDQLERYKLQLIPSIKEISLSSKSCGCFQSSKKSVGAVRVAAVSNHQRDQLEQKEMAASNLQRDQLKK